MGIVFDVNKEQLNFYHIKNNIHNKLSGKLSRDRGGNLNISISKELSLSLLLIISRINVKKKSLIKSVTNSQLYPNEVPNTTEVQEPNARVSPVLNPTYIQT